MKDLSYPHWKKIAWNGIQFEIPENWQIGLVGPQYLVIEEESLPVLEIKWNKIKGKFSHKSHLRRLTKIRGKGLEKPVKQSPLPMEWSGILEGFDSTAFKWQSNTTKGKGLILFCPQCRKASLIQFYERGSYQAKEYSKHILASFQDHNEEDCFLYSIFGIKVEIPKTYRLARYKFLAGKYELGFSARRDELQLFRWGPASVLLRDIDLTLFSQGQFNIDSASRFNLTKKNDRFIEWDLSPPVIRLGNILSRIGVKYPYQWIRIWSREDNNYIFGMNRKGIKAEDMAVLNQIYTTYENI